MLVRTLRRHIERARDSALPVPRFECAMFDRAPERRLDPRHHLVHREGLGQVVVGARIKPFHAIMQRVTRRQHEAGNAESGAAHALQHGEPVAVG